MRNIWNFDELWNLQKKLTKPAKERFVWYHFLPAWLVYSLRSCDFQQGKKREYGTFRKHLMKKIFISSFQLLRTWQQLWRFFSNFNVPSNLCARWTCVIILEMFWNCLLIGYLSTLELFLLTSFGLITLHFQQVVPRRQRHNVVFCWEDVVCLS